MWRLFFLNRLPGGVFIFYGLAIWQLPSHIASAKWWWDRIAILGNDYVAGAVLATGVLLLFRPELVRLWKLASGAVLPRSWFRKRPTHRSWLNKTFDDHPEMLIPTEKELEVGKNFIAQDAASKPQLRTPLRRLRWELRKWLLD